MRPFYEKHTPSLSPFTNLFIWFQNVSLTTNKVKDTHENERKVHFIKREMAFKKLNDIRFQFKQSCQLKRHNVNVFWKGHIFLPNNPFTMFEQIYLRNRRSCDKELIIQITRAHAFSRLPSKMKRRDGIKRVYKAGKHFQGSTQRKHLKSKQVSLHRKASTFY